MDYFHYKNAEYHAEDVALSTIAAQIGTPFYCYSTATLKRHYSVFAESLRALNPRICFAMKANDNIGVVATLARLGAGVDVVSQGEIMIALRAGVPADKIVFSGVGKTAEEMSFALKTGIYQFNVESEPELLQLDEVARAFGTRAPIAIRVNPDVVAGTHAKISTGQKESKFGIDMAAALPVFRLASRLSGIRVQGVSVHIGSQLTRLAPFAEAFTRVREFVRELRAAGVNVETVDLGGGLGVPYGLDEPPLPQDYAQVVAKCVDGLDVQLIMEPGRLLVGNAGVLVSRVIYVKRTQSRTFVILDAGMNDLIRPTLYDAHHDIMHVHAPSADAAAELVDVVGPVCETGDIFAADRLLSVPNAGDLLAFRTAGAYGAVMAGTYNARPLVAEVMVNGSEYSVVRPRQTYESLVHSTFIPEWVS